MDKYEFNIKVEQIKKLTTKGDYETAMKIADTIDWRRVRNANLLSMIAQVYERNEEYQEAKDILLLAFERAPIGKRLLFKLTDLALKEGNVEEAEAYYREFCELAPDDSRQHLLRYLILKQKSAPNEQLIHSLESYTTEELDEKWLYELASLYHKEGDGNRCILTCDKIMLMFGLGKYVDKAMELKLHYAPLTKYQMDLVENRDKYEAKLRAVEQSYDAGMEEDEEVYGGEMREPVTAVAGLRPEPEPESEPEPQPELHQELPPLVDHDPLMAVKQAEAEEHLAEQMSKMSFDDYTEESPAEKTRILGDLKAIKRSVPEEGIAEPKVVKALREVEVEKPMVAAKAEPGGQYIMIQGRTPEKGLEMAVEVLKELQTKTGVKNPVAKTNGSKLNKKGLIAAAEKLSGKDLIIEEAGDLSQEMIGELEVFLKRGTGSMRIILVDNPKQMEMLAGEYPSLRQWFRFSDRKEAPKVEPGAELDDRPVRHVKPERPEYQIPIQKVVQEPELAPDDEGEMDIDEFAQYACKYAAEIDCSITGKSMLALYERIEIMEEDGILLTRSNAEELIEDAADKAEKPSLGKLITGVFSSKYGKDGLLILKEEHFI